MRNANLVTTTVSGADRCGGGGAPPIAGDVLHVVGCLADQKGKAAVAAIAKAEP